MNLAFILDAAATMCPEREAIWDGRERLSYAALRARARAWAGWLQARAAGRPVLYLGVGGAGFVAALYGATEAGLLFVPVNYRLKPAELEAVVDVVGPGAVITDDRYRQAVEAALGTPSQVAVVETGFRPPAPERLVADEEGAGPAIGLFTSGTSSAPKLALLTHDNLTEYVLNTVEAGSAGAEEAVLICTPPYHVAAIANVVSNTFRTRRIALLGQFEAVAWLEAVRDARVTHAMVVPTMLKRILDALEARPDLAPTTLANLAYGGAKAQAGLVERALQVLPATVGLVNAFGLTETSSTVAMLGPEDHRAALSSADPAVRARLHSVGRAVPGVTIAVVSERGEPLPPGAEGEVWIRGSQVSAGYRGGGSKTDPAGWLHTGDLGHLDGAGYLFIHGRKDDMIIRGGENLDPGEIETALLAHPRVEEAVVFGVPDEEWGQTIGALVVAGSAGEAELKDWVRSRLAGYKVPSRILVVDRLPQNEMGKVGRRAALAILAAQGSSEMTSSVESARK